MIRIPWSDTRVATSMPAGTNSSSPFLRTNSPSLYTILPSPSITIPICKKPVVRKGALPLTLISRQLK